MPSPPLVSQAQLFLVCSSWGLFSKEGHHLLNNNILKGGNNEKGINAVDDTKGSKSVLSVFKNLVRPPEEVVLLHVERLEGKTLMIDMLSECEITTLKESLNGH
jgi:hypothetical protein